MQFFSIETDNFCDFGIIRAPELAMQVGFFRGRAIKLEDLPKLHFTIDFPDDEAIPHLLGNTIPLVSKEFLNLLDEQGVNNYQAFPSQLENLKTGRRIDNFFAFNVPGMLSKENIIGADNVNKDSDNEVTVISSGVFHKLSSDSAATPQPELFRLAEQPSKLICSNRIIDKMSSKRPVSGWRIDVINFSDKLY